MSQTDIIKFCKDLGCCDGCCLRYIGLKNSAAYENSKEFIQKYQEKNSQSISTTDSTNHDPGSNLTKDSMNQSSIDINSPIEKENGNSMELNGGPPAKRPKLNGVCISCMGVLQEDSWSDSYAMVKEQLEKKRYECKTFACALSAPIATIIREKAITLMLNDAFKNYDTKQLTPLKEAWKWSFGVQLAKNINMLLDSGAVSPLLITLNFEYPDDLQELEILKTLSPSLFESRSRQRRRYAVEFTRRSAEQALAGATLAALLAAGWVAAAAAAAAAASCVSVVCTHSPVYLGGRYIKMSRELPQTPWILNGKRMMESSVQEIIFDPIARIYGLAPEEVEHRMKFMSAGREDVDVRCLGEGRPFAIEITDPRRELTAAELAQACEEISKGTIIVKNMVHVTRDDLTLLKKGEETKCKTYEALCIKLSHSKHDTQANGDTQVTVSEQDIQNINTYRNTPKEQPARIQLTQKTPIRVLHRRPLLARSRQILDLKAEAVPDHPQLFVVQVRTEAGTYVKEWVHGELGRTRPSLAEAVAAPLDILALDVASVELCWPDKP